ncbi:GvpL/GvpF family gas vesicle protein [Thalassobacillus sp. CUG 92003]|uniref:GvpL/GvpF family gas vesicle protein n=1 Tax=Thalassobacillus sp. CUG 92003 TaxID=2736641 RepID=UPI0015E785AA|nr:GvpL/GvpF family gas vesicle protein [Thalassobacillus sp. CUG 92003]
MSEETGVYIFCGIQSEQETDFGTVQFEGEERNIFTLHYEDAAMVAAEVPMKIYHPNKENLMVHQQVISNVMQIEDTVIPISFGNVFHSDADVIKLLENLYPQFKELFPQIKGKIEVGLKVIGKKDWLENEIHKQPNVREKKQTVDQKSRDAGYFDRIELGEMAQQFFQSIQHDVKSSIHEPLTKLAESERENELIGEKMLLNAAYLIDRDQEDAFDEKVNEAHEQWKDKVDFKYTGPWPAYNFINIHLKVEEGS